MIDTKSFGPKDKKVIRENPGKTPHELYELGLTPKAFERLLSGDYNTTEDPKDDTTDLDNPKDDTQDDVIIPKATDNKGPLKPSSVQQVATASAPAKPILSVPKPQATITPRPTPGNVVLVNIKTGRVFTASASAGKILLNNPNEYRKA
jgi:hypothetical protein